MKRWTYNIFLLIVLSNIQTLSYSQSPYYSESLVKYDLSTHKTDKPIPFDKSFTLIVEKLSSKNIHAIHAYESKFEKGNRILVKNTYKDCDCSVQTSSIKDIELKTNPYTDTLQIFFPPLKPNVDFDINIIYGLSNECRNQLMNVNSYIFQGNASASSQFSKFWNCTFDKVTNRTYTDINFLQYQAFFKSKLEDIYNKLSNIANYSTSGEILENQAQAIDIATSKHLSDFKDGYYLFEVTRRRLFTDIILGNIDISKVFLSSTEALTSLPFAHVRIQNLKSNIKFIDTLLVRIDKLISKAVINLTVSGTTVDLKVTRNNVALIQANILNNHSILEADIKIINEIINSDSRLKQGIYIVGNTLSTDLKSAGGNVLFLDAGFTNIVAPGLTKKVAYIPKLYWGVSIYFRSIDKNTRRGKFPSTFMPPLSNGCRLDPLTRAYSYGPDYGIVARNSIWQHLSLNVGLTVGAMANKDYDNFYNNSSLLIGPAYRFARAFKVSSGIALLNRTSKNPFISEKKIIPAGYVSLSVDIDFIQGLKDVTSILFK